jgi:hypothetical protein
MRDAVAERILFFSSKNNDLKTRFVIRISTPYAVDENKVEFSVGNGLVGCRIETEGLEKEYHHEVYGMDSVQALNMATNLEPFLMRLQKKFDLFFPSGEPYFEGEKG